MAILLIGVVAVIWFFPDLLRTKSDAAFLSEAALLAQMKAEQIRRDDTTSTTLTQISQLTEPSAPVAFAEDSRLSYSFSGVSLLYPADDALRGTAGVARVIVRYSDTYRKPRNDNPADNVLYELRFGP